MTTPPETAERTLPWSRIGTQFKTPPDTLKDALIEAGLNWEVDLHTLSWKDEEGRQNEIEGQYAIVRQDNREVLNIVGSRYVPVQNRDALAFVDELSGQGEIMCAWQERGGRAVGVACALNRESPISIGEDQIQPYLVFLTSHDGSRTIQAMVVNIQLHCMNQLPGLARKGLPRWRAFHTSNISERMKMAARALKLVDSHNDALVDELSRLTEIKITDAMFEFIVKENIADLGFGPSAESQIYMGICDLWERPQTLKDESLHRTGYGLMHAVTEYWDHKRPYRTQNSAFDVNQRGKGKRSRDRLHRRLLQIANWDLPPPSLP